MLLYLTEKPKTARQLSAVLGPHKHIRASGPGHFAGHKEGDGWRVLWLSGHMYQLLEPHDWEPGLKQWRLQDLPILHETPEWKVKTTLDYPPPEEVQAQVEHAQRLFEDSTVVILATDADQEGQVIGDVFLEQTGWKGPVKRFWTDLWEENGIRQALANLRDNSEFRGQYEAGVSRIVSDQMIGINFTRLFSLKAQQAGYTFTANVGRVQSPAARIAVDQHNRAISHNARHYYTVSATLLHDEMPFQAELIVPNSLLEDGKHCFNKEPIAEIFNQISRETHAKVTNLREQQNQTPPPLPFCLNTLSQYCAKNYLMMPNETSAAAQSLYEQGFLSYPRGDSENFEASLLAIFPATFQALARLDEHLAVAVQKADINNPQPVFVDQDVKSHSALFVSRNMPDLSGLTIEEKRVYIAVAKRMIAQFYPNRVSASTKIHLSIGNVLFSADSTVLITEGWAYLEAHEESDSITLPHLKTGDLCKIDKIEISDKKTKAPPRLTVDAFQAIMKDCTHLLSPAIKQKVGHGMLGTGATQDKYLTKLCDQGILKIEEKKYVTPTKRGLELHSLLPQTIASPDLTSLWEIHFRAIRNGQKTGVDFIKSVATWVDREVGRHRAVKFKPAPTMTPCERCESAMLRKSQKKDKNAFYWICSNNECRTMTPDDWGKPVKLHPMDGKPCTKCNYPMKTRISKDSREKSRAPFAGCSNTECKHSEK